MIDRGQKFSRAPVPGHPSTPATEAGVLKTAEAPAKFNPGCRSRGFRNVNPGNRGRGPGQNFVGPQPTGAEVRSIPNCYS